MKKTTIVGFAIAAVIAGCNQTEAPTSQNGAYSLDKVVWNDGTKDTEALATDGNTQFKIYTDASYFYIAQAKDSSVSFGVGSYTQKDAKNIEEINIFNSGSLDSVGKAQLEIEKTENGYNQFIPELIVRGAKWSGTEYYTKLEGTGVSELDGLWHQAKNLEINGKDTVDRSYNEYKVYQSGHFMWAARYLDDSTKNVFTNIVGKGSFTLNKEALTEDLTFSSRKDILGKYNIIIKFNGPDEFTQKTADSAANIIGFKTYKRVSK